jgi:hypothetical protein
MDTFLRSQKGYREKKISEPPYSSSEWLAVPKRERKSEFWKVIVAILLLVLAAELLLRKEFIQALRRPDPPAERP